ncbi:MAG: hypothetical protein H7X92_09230 [Chitinophagales bacterium]|nr:hypothetical protein [Hyphomicrobiales bacterium]
MKLDAVSQLLSQLVAKTDTGLSHDQVSALQSLASLLTVHSHVNLQAFIGVVSNISSSKFDQKVKNHPPLKTPTAVIVSAFVQKLNDALGDQNKFEDVLQQIGKRSLAVIDAVEIANQFAWQKPKISTKPKAISRIKEVQANYLSAGRKSNQNAGRSAA